MTLLALIIPAAILQAALPCSFSTSAGVQDGVRLPRRAPSAALYAAIRTVESGGNDRAIGDGGRAKGPYQIHRGYWRDGCEFGKVRWSYDKHVWDRAKCQQVVAWYWQRYGASTDEERARMHNGGPRGHEKAATLGYWLKVEAALKGGGK